MASEESMPSRRFAGHRPQPARAAGDVQDARITQTSRPQLLDQAAIPPGRSLTVEPALGVVSGDGVVLPVRQP